jgi:hypothetical protein
MEERGEERSNVDHNKSGALVKQNTFFQLFPKHV